MGHLMRYEPFSIEPVSELLQKLFRASRGLALDTESPLAEIKLDITEDDAAYTVKAELPGVEKDKIDVQVQGNSVSIFAKTEGGKELKEGDRVVCRERFTDISFAGKIAFCPKTAADKLENIGLAAPAP